MDLKKYKVKNNKGVQHQVANKQGSEHLNLLVPNKLGLAQRQEMYK